MFSTESLTPEKSQVITKIKGSHIKQSIKYINKKGTFKQTEQCASCQFCGSVQIGLGFALDISCDREKGFWKMHCGETDRPCKYAQPIVREEVDSK